MSALRLYFLYAIVFAAGAAVLIVEILGTRILSPFYGATIFVWTSLIIVALGALAAGYLVGGRIADASPKAFTLDLIIVAAGLLMFVPKRIDQWVLPFTDGLGLRYGPLGAAIILFAPALFLLGMVTPFVVRLIVKRVEESGSSAGKIFALATLGSIAGGLLAGFYLLDKFSVSQIFEYTALFLVLLGSIGVFLEEKNKAYAGATVLIFFVTASAATFVSPIQYSDAYTLEIIDQQQTFYGDLKVIEIGISKCAAVNGSIQSCVLRTTGETSYTFIPEVHRILEERNAESFLLLGLGAGNLLQEMSEDIDVTVVEIEPALKEIGEKYFSLNDSQYDTLIFDDARHFLATQENQYDVVLMDVFLGNALPVYMFSKEAFEDAAKAVAPGGVLLVNMEGKTGPEDEQIAAIFKTAREVFPTGFLTTSDLEDYISVMLHFSQDSEYAFRGGGRFVEAPLYWEQAPVVTDDKNYLEILSIRKLAIFLDEMKKLGGLKLLFSS